MQELCGTREVADNIKPYLRSSIDDGIVDELQAANIVYVAALGADQLTWVSAVCRRASSSVPLVHVLGPGQVRVTGEVGSDDPLCAALRQPNAMLGFTVMQEWTRDRFRLMGHVKPSSLSPGPVQAWRRRRRRLHPSH